MLATVELAWCLSNVTLSAYLRSLVVNVSTPSTSNTVGCTYSSTRTQFSCHEGPKAVRCSVWLLLISDVENSAVLWSVFRQPVSCFACCAKTGYYEYWRHSADIDGFTLPLSSCAVLNPSFSTAIHR
jgi:hypothetical protein